MAGKLWHVTEGVQPQAEALSHELGISVLLGQLLINRGLSEAAEARRFLAPDLADLHDPFRFQEMGRAVERLAAAIRDQEPVLIYGDYDVDGVTSVALMIRVLARFLPGKVLYYLPKRLEEGYGLHLSAVEKALAKGVRLIVTVDCGITALEEAAYLKAQGVDLIVTDHHEPQAQLPEAHALIDPKVPGCGYPFAQLAGVGVAFKLLQGLAARLPEVRERLYANLDLVAFGTVADIVPLLGENRVLVKYGLERIRQTENVGLRALIQAAGLSDREVGSGHIGFLLAPRINAAGRMGNPSIGVRLLLTSDPALAAELAKELEKENVNRQNTETLVLQEAQRQVEADPESAAERGLVLAGDGWHLGVVGIVASRLVDLYHKPVILVGMDETEGRGSGRSIPGFNLFNAIEACGGHLIRFGGHEFAAGLSVERARFPEFKKAFLEYARLKLTPEDLRPVLKLDGLLELDGITIDLARELNLLAPCGPANPTPVFGCRAVKLLESRNVGENGKHLKLKVGEGQTVRDGIGFNLGAAYREIAGAREIDVAFTLEENHWNGASQIQLNLKDVVSRGI